MAFFDRTKFLEFFDTETIVDQEIDTLRYTVTTKNEFVFSLYISPHEGYAIIMLMNKEETLPVFEIGIHGVASIVSDENHILIYKESMDVTKKPFIKIRVKPEVSLSADL